ncbi:MAG: NAD(P)-dependent glycerol-3-phosphate dehydrogenase [Deltaproteobacteria bacterium]|nr:NAD(P)-dependent glycerol-3-phosphate dehydrogenase [Deltaproteobacteria bacterium]
MQSKEKQKVIIIGAGSFGTCLAIHLARLGHQVFLWSYETSIAEGINKNHRNPQFLSNVVIPDNVSAFSGEDLLLQHLSGSAVVLATPTQWLRAVLEKIKYPLKDANFIVSVVKGLEIGTECFPSQIVGQVVGEDVLEKLAVLSGPSFAIEVAEGQPTGVSAGSRNLAIAKHAQELFHSPQFRVYTSNDPVGLEVAGALKNVIALASGACSGLGFQNNSRAALITRGLAEITRIGVALGANPLTFKGLGGVGDLFLTCSSEKSRNFTVGYRLGKGERLDEVLRTLGSVAEGVATAKAAYSLVQRLGVRAPIITVVYEVLSQKKPLKNAAEELTHADARHELEFDVTLGLPQQKTS